MAEKDASVEEILRKHVPEAELERVWRVLYGKKNWSMTESLVLYCLFIYLSVYCLLVRSFVRLFVRSCFVRSFVN